MTAGATAAPASQAAPDSRTSRSGTMVGVRPGWITIAGKEFTDHLLSVRFYVLVFVLGMAAMIPLYFAGETIRSLAEVASGSSAVFLALFYLTPNREVDILRVYTFVAIAAPLLGVGFAFDAVNGERHQGTLPRLLSQPIHRDDVINGKFAAGLAAIGVILTAVTLLVAAIGIIQLGILPRPEQVLRLAVWLVLAIAYVGFWLAFALLCSVVVRRASTSALMAIGTWLVLTLFAALLVGIVAGFLAPAGSGASAEEQIANVGLQYELARLSPNRLFEEATAALLDPTTRAVGLAPLLLTPADRPAPGSLLSLDQSLLVIWPQFVSLIALTALAFALAYVSFMRQEVRA